MFGFYFKSGDSGLENTPRISNQHCVRGVVPGCFHPANQKNLGYCGTSVGLWTNCRLGTVQRGGRGSYRSSHTSIRCTGRYWYHHSSGLRGWAWHRRGNGGCLRPLRMDRRQRPCVDFCHMWSHVCDHRGHGFGELGSTPRLHTATEAHRRYARQQHHWYL